MSVATAVHSDLLSNHPDVTSTLVAILAQPFATLESRIETVKESMRSLTDVETQRYKSYKKTLARLEATQRFFGSLTPTALDKDSTAALPVFLGLMAQCAAHDTSSALDTNLDEEVDDQSRFRWKEHTLELILIGMASFVNNLIKVNEPACLEIADDRADVVHITTDNDNLAELLAFLELNRNEGEEIFQCMSCPGESGPAIDSLAWKKSWEKEIERLKALCKSFDGALRRYVEKPTLITYRSKEVKMESKGEAHLMLVQETETANLSGHMAAARREERGYVKTSVVRTQYWKERNELLNKATCDLSGTNSC